MAIDATVAGASANAYLTVAAADALATADLGLNAKEWLAATADAKEAALVRATEEIDAEIGRVVYPATATQSLLFPRSTDYAIDGTTRIIPPRLGRATFLQAAYLLKNAELLDQAASRRARGLANFSNPDGTSGQLSEDDSFGALHPRVRRLLVEFAEGSVVGIIIPT